VTLQEFEEQIILVALASTVCDIPVVLRSTSTAIKLRVEVRSIGFIDVFYNESTGITAYALIQENQRIFGADNTGGWHTHPFAAPDRHDDLLEAMPFADFIAEVEREFNND